MAHRSVSRRGFLQGMLAAGTAPLFIRAPLFGANAPSNRLNVAFIGTGNQGMNLLKKFVDADLGEVVGVCDVNQGSFGYKDEKQFCGREPAKALVDASVAARKKSGASAGSACRAHSDFREVIARPDVDAVFIVAPDHWHEIMTIRAVRAGKDVYCEKPLSLTVVGGREMVDEARKHQRVLQTGSHERSNPISRFICEAAKRGAIGKIQRIITNVGENNKVGPGPGWQPQPVPEGFDYEMWLGPAPKVAYHPDRCLYRFRFNYDYSGAQIANFGAHSNDMAHWGMGLDRGTDLKIECRDAEFLPAGSLFNTATKTDFRVEYPNGVELICKTGQPPVQVRFEGEDGWLQTGYGGTTASRPELLEGLPTKKEAALTNVLHMQNFLDCVKSRKEPVATGEIGHASATLCHLANIAIRRFPETGPGTVYEWSNAKEQFTNHEAANEMLNRTRRSPWNDLNA